MYLEDLEKLLFKSKDKSKDENKVKRLDEKCKVIVGVSGGADSICLLHMLYTKGFDIVAVHINHNLRGEESKRDENFVRRFCENLKITLEVERISIEKKKESLEQWKEQKVCPALNLLAVCFY